MTRERDEGSLHNMRHTSDVVASVLHEVANIGATDREILRTHPGKGFSNLKFGMSRLHGYAQELGVPESGYAEVEQRAQEQFVKGFELCESPIERSMLAALLTGHWAGFNALPPIVHDARKAVNEMLPKAEVVIVPQLAFLRYRLDFGIVVVKDRKLQIIDVECDGKAFHTDPIADNDRTAYLNSWNIPVFRATGADLYENAVREADRIIYGITAWKAGQ